MGNLVTHTNCSGLYEKHVSLENFPLNATWCKWCLCCAGKKQACPAAWKPAGSPQEPGAIRRGTRWGPWRQPDQLSWPERGCFPDRKGRFWNHGKGGINVFWSWDQVPHWHLRMPLPLGPAHASFVLSKCRVFLIFTAALRVPTSPAAQCMWLCSIQGKAMG